MSAQLLPITCEPPGAGIEELLDQLREAHASGELSAIAVAVVYRDGSTGSLTSPTPSYATMIGALDLARHRMLMKGYIEC